MHTELSRFVPHATFSVESPTWWVEALIYATSVIVIGTELKIWNSVRIQIKLEEQERLLLHSRMEALQNQINPHFLFNTLNSVSSLVRFDPDTARELIIKLANILRRLLNSSDAFVPLREEVEFIDNYLDIEVVRFGRDKLRVVKELETSSLDTMVPSMLLQPLVENSIKHGLSSKIDGGSIYLRSRLTDSHLIIEVEDDGVGMGCGQSAGAADGLGRNRHRHGQRGGAAESSLRRHGANDHRQPRRERELWSGCACRFCKDRAQFRKPSTKPAPARAGKTPHTAE